jgi:hypothetical protein
MQTMHYTHANQKKDSQLYSSKDLLTPKGPSVFLLKIASKQPLLKAN